MRYYDAFLKYIERIRKDGYSVVFTGEVNTAHREIDLARPKENEKNTGFLPEERAWIDQVISKGYVDTFRYLHPEKKDAYSWWDMKTFARERNVGWRIDYFFVSDDMTPLIKKADILSNVMGSDHCPIFLNVAL
jgi:exodeoxyribonuclease-3